MRSTLVTQVIICLLMVVMASACQNKTTKQTFVPVTDREVYDVVDALIKQRGLDTINFNNEQPLRIIDSLENNKVYFAKTVSLSDSTTLMAPPPLTSKWVNGWGLISSKHKYFTVKDTAFFTYQNEHPNKLILKSGRFNITRLISMKNAKKLEQQGVKCPVLVLSIPVFSVDHNKAYIATDLFYRAGSGYGSGNGFYLVKVNNKWVVMFRENTWIS